MLLLLPLQIVQKVVHGNSSTATSANTCTGNSATATKLKTARNIKLQGAVSGNVNFDGSGNVVITTTQANIAVLTGSFELPGSGTLAGSVNINYPTGYSKDNSIIISLMGHGKVNDSWWSTSTAPDFNTALTRGTGNLGASLKSSNITISAQKIDASANADTITFKLVLMKIN